MSRSRFLDLPAELRLDIYDQVFSTSRPMDLLSKKGPDNALRATCKFIYAESEKAFSRASNRHPRVRADLLDELISDYEKAVSPHRSVVFLPPINRAATLLRSINDHCLHACAKDGCYMCDDKAHRECFDCGRNVAIALWCYDNPDDSPALVEKGFGGKKLTPLGEFIVSVRPVALRRIKNRVDQSKVDRWWQRELDMQIAIDYRCELRRATVETFWASPAASASEFTANNIELMEMQDSGMAQYQLIAKKHGEEGFLDWEPEYERRVRARSTQAGALLPPQIPIKRTEEKLRALQHRFNATTHLGRFNTRVRGGRVEMSRPPPLLKRRGVSDMPALALAQYAASVAGGGMEQIQQQAVMAA